MVRWLALIWLSIVILAMVALFGPMVVWIVMGIVVGIVVGVVTVLSLIIVVEWFVDLW